MFHLDALIDDKILIPVEITRENKENIVKVWI